ncbi:MAG: hypothetical protein JWL77_5789 [Chthonomonadaceae bacterium]|nr:hypothetical protein [Chthonomonadaceae bacterium]
MHFRSTFIIAITLFACIGLASQAQQGVRNSGPSRSDKLKTTAVALPERIEIYPTHVDLDSRRAYRQFVVTGYFHGEARDLTQQAVLRSTDAHIATVHGSRVLAVGDGKTDLVVAAGGRTVHVPVTVANTAAPDPVQFKFETLAILTKQGCATGSCHGSPHGKGGFSLSLFGYDPHIDSVSLTRDGFNRRLNVMEPADSLIMKKPLLEIPHVGGKRLRKTDAGYQVLRDWIYEGAHVDLPQTDCTKIVITPGSSRLLHAPNLKQQLSVVAYYSDGSSRDVSAIATYESSNPNLVKVEPDGLITGIERGQAAVSVRYLDKFESVFVTVVQDVLGFQWSGPRENNVVDRLVDAKLKQLQYLPSGICTDPVFLRRVYLDLTGLPPTSAQVRAFLKDTRADKRAQVIDALLNTEEFARFQALKKADLMRVSPRTMKGGRADLFAQWLVDAFRKNMPYDQFARTLLTASGDTMAVAPANYFLAIPTMEERTEMTAQLFMGTRVECTKCHNHPFENWTMRDYYSIGAVFARTEVTRAGIVQFTNAGEVQHPTTHAVMTPWGSTVGQKTQDRRAAFAAWLTRPGNPFFARVEVNRMWADLMGRGIVNPVDDFRSSNPPANVPLLDALAQEFERCGYDRKHILRLLCNSRTYQSDTQPNKFNATDEALFSHARIRMLTAEQLKDAIGMTTNALLPPAQFAAEEQKLREKFMADGGKSEPMKQELARMEGRMQYATQRPYPEQSAFNTTFGQPQRETACTCERQNSPTLLEALELLNGGTAYRMAETGARHFAGMTDAALIEELYLSALARFPTQKEQATAQQFLAKASNRENAVTDLIWTVLNTQEFLFQH